MNSAQHNEALSRLLSHALRHGPARYGIALDGAGWTDIDCLIAALRAFDDRWCDLQRADIVAMIASSAKTRHEIAGDRIRAIYGHSQDVTAATAVDALPSQLFHGTTDKAWEAIRREGLRPMQRRYVRLSADRETAVAVALRRTSEPVILLVDSSAAAGAGVTFYLGERGIWLSDPIPAAFLATES